MIIYPYFAKQSLRRIVMITINYIIFVIETKEIEMGLLSNISLVQTCGWIGTPEIIIIVVIILLLFGGKKIPELMRGLGKGVKEFKDGVSEDNNNANEKDDTKKD